MLGKKGGKAKFKKHGSDGMSEMAKKRWANKTPEERKAWSEKMVAARRKKAENRG